ncbi:RING-type domain-containing protein [Aphelenchoides besseyi]|nr:RING-type domain-containing protein [Aphelenchoides besseyi]KAI6199030.1 RING-type domain-containing protein [Aphelenchoides besseyi]
MPTAPPFVRCGICLETFSTADASPLACGHRFCSGCLTLCQQLVTCPMVGCIAPRNPEVLVDEMDQEEDAANELGERMNRIGLGRLPAMLQLEERQRCEGRRGRFQCVNAARMTLLDCRHLVCFDCLSKSVLAATATHERPRCPLPRCTNRLTKSELKRISERVHTIHDTCVRLMDVAIDAGNEPKPLAKDEIRVFCSVYNSDQATRAITLPKNCTIGDMISALFQIQRVDRNRNAATASVFIRLSSESAKARYELLNPKVVGKKLLREANINDKAHLVLDLNNEIPK